MFCFIFFFICFINVIISKFVIVYRNRILLLPFGNYLVKLTFFVSHKEWNNIAKLKKNLKFTIKMFLRIIKISFFWVKHDWKALTTILKDVHYKEENPWCLPPWNRNDYDLNLFISFYVLIYNAKALLKGTTPYTPCIWKQV